MMMKSDLSIAALIEYAEQMYPKQEIVSRAVEGGIHRYNYQQAAQRSRQLANALKNKLDIELDDVVGTLAWNTYRHFELYFAVSGMGSVLHTINPRLFPEQVVYIINHAQDKAIFVDVNILPLLEGIHPHLKHLKHIVVMTDEAHMPKSSPLNNLICYESLIEDQPNTFDWPLLDEDTGSALCYTSGTTGNPKGVMYTHRSTVLHSQAVVRRDGLDLHEGSTVLPVVPMFHVNAWGVPYAAAMVGAKLVLPGAGMDGKSLYELIDAEQANQILGVPTLWMGLLQHCETAGVTLDSVETVVIGGSAASLRLVKEFQEKHNAFVLHAWGMTETSPLGTANVLDKQMRVLPLEARYQAQLKQGKPVFGVDLKIINDEGEALPWDGKTFGRLLIRAPWVASEYFKSDDRSAFIDGWFDTGDVATIDENGVMHIVDRAKDVIKSGGEWISSIDLENAASTHPAIQECCVIGVPHKKWTERPLMLVVKKPDAALSSDEVIAFLTDKVAKWWLPDDVVFVDELPHTATGKLKKTGLREEYANHLL